MKVEEDGRCFPVTDDSATIVNCLSASASRAKVEVRMGSNVKAVYPLEPKGFRIVVETNGVTKELTCDRLLMATGSSRAGHR